MSRRTFGSLLTELRRQRGLSQMRLAELLCQATGSTTVSRHEISRWERGDRVPGARWLSRLSLVLDVPVARLASAARESRPITTSARDPVGELVRVAQGWAGRDTGPVPVADGRPPGRLIDDLRRMDDLVGGADLAATAGRHWREARRALPAVGAPRRRALSPAAELAQLAGWTAADAGDHAAALRAFQDGLLLADEGGDRPLAAHLLGCASHALAVDDPRAALALARLGSAGARRTGSAGLRALLRHRAAFAAARLGDQATAQDALLAARRLGERIDPVAEPSWLYWLDPVELSAMAGRTLVVLGRPMRALPLLAGARHSARQPPPDTARQPRTAALRSGWLARALLDVGELEEACDVGRTALVDAVRSGSVRAAAHTRELAARLRARPAAAVTRELRDLIDGALPYLPDGPRRRART